VHAVPDVLKDPRALIFRVEKPGRHLDLDDEGSIIL
jgi:hypothetical protein